MSKSYIPAGYTAQMTLYETQKAIEETRSFFQKRLSEALHLIRVSAPLFVTKESGLNDNLKVITLPKSLYGSRIRIGIERFAKDYGLNVSFMTNTPDEILKGDTFLVLNSQLDWGLADLARKVDEKKLTIGKDVFIISYNDFALNDVVLGGLTTISTDFAEMGRLPADMIITGKLSKIHCPFSMNRRHTF